MNPTVPATPAERQADFLRALANHLDAHPDLAMVYIGPRWGGSPAATSLHPSGPGDELDNLTAWARSLGATTVRLDPVGSVHVHVDTTLADYPVDLVGVTWRLDAELYTEDQVLTLDELAAALLETQQRAEGTH